MCFLNGGDANRPCTVWQRINTEKSEKPAGFSFSAVREEPNEHLYERPVPGPRALEERKGKNNEKQRKRGKYGQGGGEGGGGG